MVYFIGIKKTKHYILNHEKQVPWVEVISVVLKSSKIIRRKGDKLEIETNTHYILCELNNNILHIINAKRK